MFVVVFEVCDVDKVVVMIIEDMEFFYDKDGKLVSNCEDFCCSVVSLCSSVCKGGW